MSVADAVNTPSGQRRETIELPACTLEGAPGYRQEHSGDSAQVSIESIGASFHLPKDAILSLDEKRSIS